MEKKKKKKKEQNHPLNRLHRLLLIEEKCLKNNLEYHSNIICVNLLFCLFV